MEIAQAARVLCLIALYTLCGNKKLYARQTQILFLYRQLVPASSEYGQSEFPVD